MHKKTIKSTASNYCYKYGLNENEHVKELELLVAQHYPRQYAIYIRICQLAVNSIVTEFPKWFIVEIDSEKNETLLEGPDHHFLPMYCFCGGKRKKLNMVINRATSTKKIRIYK